MTHAVREATAGDREAVVRLLDAAMLSFDRERIRQRVADGDGLVAVVRGHNREERRRAEDPVGPDDGRVVGVCVLGDQRSGPTEIEHVAVHRSRRGRAVGTDLVTAAAARVDGPLVARFREGVRPFYESLGFEIDTAAADADADANAAGGPEDAGGGRLRGVLR